MASIQMCTFILDRYLFGVDVRQVQEVLRWQPMTRVPLAPGLVRGLINLRGQIVTAFDLRERLGLPHREDGAQPVNVVLRRDDGAVALLVDDIGDVVDIEEATLERPPHTLRGPAAEVVKWVVQRPGSLLCVMDTARVTAGA
ncbi:MAG: chemotaxis protein CheW [Deltaproteobacteria bacterium]